MNKEQVYDSLVSPLMQKIISICKENGIAMMASYDIAHDGEGPNGEDCSRLTCDTLLPNGEHEHNNLFVQANAIIRRGGRAAPMMITTQHGDGTASMTAVV